MRIMLYYKWLRGIFVIIIQEAIMLSIYPACFYKEDNGYSVIFPDIKQLQTSGDSFENAMKEAVNTLASHLYSCKRDESPLPISSKLESVDPLKVLNEVSPHKEIKETVVNMVSVDVEAYAKEHFKKSVRKNLTIPAWLNEAAMEKGINFSQTLQEALIEKLWS